MLILAWHTIFYFILIFYENIDYTLAFKGRHILPQSDFGPKLVRLILTEPHDSFSLPKSRLQTQINPSYSLVT